MSWRKTFSTTVGRGRNLLLSRNEELVCKNLMCENVSLPCLCKLERLLQSLKADDLDSLDLSHNNLTTLPPSLIKMKSLQSLHLQGNKFSSFPLTSLESLDFLRYLDITENPFLEHENGNIWRKTTFPSLPIHLQNAIIAARKKTNKRE